MLMLGIEKQPNCSLARHEVKCSLGCVIRGIFAGQFSSFVCHGCAGLPSGFLGCPLCVMPNENPSDPGCVSNCIKNPNTDYPGHIPGSVYQNLDNLDMYPGKSTFGSDTFPGYTIYPFFQPRSCPDHGRLIADVGCSSSLCSTSIAQQRLPGVFGRNLGIQNEASLGEIKQQAVLLVQK